MIGVAGLTLGSSAAGAGSDTDKSGEFDLIETTVSDIREALLSEELTAQALVEHYLARIEEYDDQLNTFMTVNDDAVDRAKELDDTFSKSGPVGPLHGVPIVLKDNYDTKDLPTTGGSLMLEGFVPEEDAFQVAKLREASAIILGISIRSTVDRLSG